MNLLLLHPEDIICADTACIQGNRLKHIIQVHRSKPGDSIRLGQINGLMGEGVIQELDQKRCIIEFKLEQAPPAALPVTVIMALPRPKMLRRILRFTAEIGVKQLYLINSYRVEKSFWQSPVLKPENTLEFLYQGLEQAKDTILPEVVLKPRFKPFVEDELAIISANTQALIAHPGNNPAPPPCPHQINQASTLVIGPEGGFIPYEVSLIQAQGFQQIGLGPRILRVENAYSSIIAKLFD